MTIDDSRERPAAMKPVRLVADDLTGALDGATRFCVAAEDFPVYFDPPYRPVESAALSLGTREADRNAAEAAMVAALPFLSAGTAFKKIDSLLRGHWPVELAAVLRSRRFRSCILAPAFPEQGRLTVGGRQHVRHDRVIEPVGRDIATALAQESVGTCRIEAGSLPLEAPPEGVVLVCDASTSADLACIAAWGAELPAPVLWCGSAGLAGALAGMPSRMVRAVEAPLLAVVGSYHPVSLRQVAAAGAAFPRSSIRIDPMRPADPGPIAECLRVSGACLVSFDAGDAGADIPVAIERWIAAAVPQLPRPRTLFASGGETLLSLCRAASVDHLRLTGERSAGVPVSHISGGPWEGVRVISKSGAFGDAGLVRLLLADAVADFHPG